MNKGFGLARLPCEKTRAYFVVGEIRNGKLCVCLYQGVSYRFYTAPRDLGYLGFMSLIKPVILFITSALFRRDAEKVERHGRLQTGRGQRRQRHFALAKCDGEHSSRRCEREVMGQGGGMLSINKEG